MIQQMIRAYSESKLLDYVARLQRIGWKPIGEAYKEGLYHYQAMVRE